MAANHGGARGGSGRKPLREKHAVKIGKAEALYAAHLEQAARNLIAIADGTTERVEEEWAPAGTVMVEAPMTYPNGQPMLGSSGKAIMGKVCAFPDKAPAELVLVKRKIVSLPPDREANQYITDRILGKTAPLVEEEAPEPELTDEEALVAAKIFLERHGAKIVLAQVAADAKSATTPTGAASEIP